MRDKGGFNRQFTKNVDKSRIKNALISYYHKEQNLDLKRAEEIAEVDLRLEKTTNVDLSDDTKVRDVAWGNWKSKMKILDAAKFESYLKGFND